MALFYQMPKKVEKSSTYDYKLTCMNYYKRIQKVIDHIELHLHDELTLIDLASVANHSPYHFHKVFSALTGVSIMEYVRKRRLSLSAQDLLMTKTSILEIALHYQFETHDSFTRAFKKHFGILPSEFRKNNKEYSPPKKMNLLTHINIHNFRSYVMDPKIIKRPSFFLLGHGLKTNTKDGNNLKEIPRFWDNYMKKELCKTIPGKINPNQEYGLCYDFNPQTLDMCYMIGYEVKNLENIPEGMCGKEVPASLYVCFTTPKVLRKDFVTSIQETTKFIYREWLPQSGYQYNENGNDFEIYDERCFGDIDCQMDIFIPIK